MKNNYLLTIALIFSFIFAVDKSKDAVAPIEQIKDSKDVTFDVDKVQKTRHLKENLNESIIQHKRESVKDQKSDQARKESRSLRKKANNVPEVKTQVRKAFKMNDQKVAENKKSKEKFKFSSKVSKKQSVKKSSTSVVPANISRDSKRTRLDKGGNTRSPDRPENSMDMDYDRVFTDPVRYSGPRNNNSVQGHSLNVDDSRSVANVLKELEAIYFNNPNEKINLSPKTNQEGSDIGSNMPINPLDIKNEIDNSNNIYSNVELLPFGGTRSGRNATVAILQVEGYTESTAIAIANILNEMNYEVYIIDPDDINSVEDALEYDVFIGGGSGDCDNTWAESGSIEYIHDAVENHGKGLIFTGWGAYCIAYDLMDGVHAEILPIVIDNSNYLAGGDNALFEIYPSDITEGVTSFYTEYADHGDGIKDGSTVHAIFSNGESAVTSWEYGLGRVVYLGHIYMGGFEAYDNENLFEEESPVRLLTNSVAWCSGGQNDDENNIELVALIQNEAPWGGNVWQEELEAREINYDLLPTSALDSMDYDQYDMIITAGGQNVDSHVFDAGSAIFEYVENGGFAFVSLCTQGLEGTFGDLAVAWGGSDSTYFLDEDHPLVDGVENPAWGNWAYHTYFAEIGDGWTEFSVGDGGIVTSVIRDGFFVHGLTVEYPGWPQEQMAGNALDFAMGYDPGDGSTPTVHITFSVDMQNEEVSEEGVHIAGSNTNDWADFGVDPETGETLPSWDPGGIEMHDDDGDGVFDVTLELEQFTGYEYKFINGDEWGDEEENENRSFYTQDWDEVLPVVCYGSWDPCETINIELVALIQNELPWGGNVWQEELEAREINYDLLPTSALDSMDYDQYDMIITTSSYNVDSHVFDAGSAIFEYVENGGIAFVSLCSQGLEGTFGDLTVEWGSSSYTYFLDEDHPLIDGVDNPASGSSASHTKFTEIGDGWTEFSFGNNGGYYGYGGPDSNIVTSVIREGFFVHGLTLEYPGWSQEQMAGNALDLAMGYDPGDDSSTFFVEGIVRNIGGGAPIEGAEVIVDIEEPLLTITDENGYYRIDLDNPGFYRVGSWADGYWADYNMVDVGEDGSQFDFLLGDMDSTALLEIWAGTDNWETVAHAELESPQSPQGHSIGDWNGWDLITVDVSWGYADVYGYADGYSDASLTVENVVAGEVYERAIYFYGDSTGNPGWLTAYVYDQDGYPIQEAHVSVWNDEFDTNSMTNEYGIAVVDDLPAGIYEVDAWAEGFESEYYGEVEIWSNEETVIEFWLEPDHQEEGFTFLGEFEDREYWVSDDIGTWHDAFYFLDSINNAEDDVHIHMATIHSQAEQDFLYNTFLEHSGEEAFWLGFTDEEEEGNWQWVTGEEVIYTNWAEGEPNNSGESEHYAVMDIGQWTLGAWNDIPNDGPLPFVVEVEFLDDDDEPVFFEKEDWADYNDPANWDHITGSVAITRADAQGLYNPYMEDGYSWENGGPMGTLWSPYPTHESNEEDYMNWVDAVEGCPPCVVQNDQILSLWVLEENKYYDIDMVSWTSGDMIEPMGGGFSYWRYSAGEDQDFELTDFEITINGNDQADIEAGESAVVTILFDDTGAETYAGMMGIFYDANFNDGLEPDEDLNLFEEDGEGPAILLVDNMEPDQNSDIGIIEFTLDAQNDDGPGFLTLFQHTSWHLTSFDPYTADFGHSTATLNVHGFESDFSISGQTDPPIPHMMVFAFSDSIETEFPHFTLTQEDGSYHVAVESSGSYFIGMDDGLDIYENLYVNPPFQFVDVYDHVSGIDFEIMEYNTMVYGHVTNPEGDGIHDAEVYFNYHDDYENVHIESDAWTDENGYYELWLQSGYEYEVHVWAYGYNDHNDYVDVEGDFEYNVTLEPWNNNEFGQIEGAVFNQDANPIQDAWVGVWNEYHWEETWTDENGHYWMEVPTGEYEMEASADGYSNQHYWGVEVYPWETTYIDFWLDWEDGDGVYFEKEDWADYNDPANWDHITGSVAITRANEQGLYNPYMEDGYSWENGSPLGTLWSPYPTHESNEEDYMNWVDAVESCPPCVVENDQILSLWVLEEDEYYDIDMVWWQDMGGGGGFAYWRYRVEDEEEDFTFLGEFEGHEYWLSNSYDTWTNANEMIQSWGEPQVHMVTVGSQEENDFLIDVFSEEEYYIGFTDEAEEGNFVWVTGEEVTYTSWCGGEPNNDNGGGQHYAISNYCGPGMWDDAYGEYDERRFIVEVGLDAESANILDVSDVPDDQGGRVYVTFARSLHDTDTLRTPEMYTVERLDGDTWVGLNSVSAYGNDVYVVEATTLADSTSENDALMTYRIIAAMDEGNFASDPESGYSVDNISPGAPTGVVAAVSGGVVYLEWAHSDANDLDYYAVYRSTDPEFIPGEENMIGLSDGPEFADDVEEFGDYYYAVTAFDVHENESDPSELVNVTLLSLVDVHGLPEAFSLHQNYPNPFNPETRIRYDVPEATNVSISIYDLMGRRIRTLVNEKTSAGYHSALWNATNEFGSPVSAGVYIYAIQAGDFRQVRKMILLK